MITENLTAENKKNPLMQLFCKRQPQVSITKPVKKINTNEHKEDDSLYKILSWRDNYVQYKKPDEKTYKIIIKDSIVTADQSQWAENVQGIWINIDWNLISFQELNQLILSEKLIYNGIIFIWGAKDNIAQIMDYFEKMNFLYVENFTFAILNRKKIPQKSQKITNGNTSLLNYFTVNKNSKQTGINKIYKKQQQKDYQIGKVENVNTIFCNQDSKYFKQTQKVLYMFRKVCKNQPLELRHQRTSDVYFTIGDSLKLDWKAKQVVYKMIETLLISANYKDKQPLKLVELWGDADKPRKGWVTVVEQKLKQEFNNPTDKEIA